MQLQPIASVCVHAGDKSCISLKESPLINVAFGVHWGLCTVWMGVMDGFGGVGGGLGGGWFSSLAERTLEVILDGIFQQNWALLEMGLTLSVSAQGKELMAGKQPGMSPSAHASTPRICAESLKTSRHLLL